MKTTVVTLEGHQFVLSTAAVAPLERHLSSLRKATLLRRHVYKENIEALRDILIEQNKKTISKTAMLSAIRIVGLPEQYPVPAVIDTYVPKLHSQIQRIAHKLKGVALPAKGRWQRYIAILLAIVALFMSVNYSFTAFNVLLMATEGSEGRWQTIDTTIGPVRSYIEPLNLSMNGDWLVSWQSSTLLAVLFLAVAILSLQLMRRKHRLVFMVLLLANLFGIIAVTQSQQQVIDFKSAHPQGTVHSSQPLVPRLAYLQQCGDEIPYAFDNQTAGMLFRQFRDEGFTLAVAIPTNYGHPDLKELCITYDALRKQHPKDAIVLQLFTTEHDGTLRPYMFSDALDNTGTYGFFVRQ